MSFANIKKLTQEQDFKRIQFLELPEGQTRIRILDEKAKDFWTHYVKGVTIKCVGEDCPICNQNQQIKIENPKNFRQINGYSSRTQRFYVNVLDRTLVKICPNCEKVNKPVNNALPHACSACNTLLTTVKATQLNKVRVLAKGVQLFEQLEAFSVAVLDEETGEPFDLTDFDIVLMVSGIGKDTKTIAIPQPQHRDTVEYKKEDLYELENAIISLEPDEILKLQRGVQLKDIFIERNYNSNADKDVLVSDDVIQENVEALFRE